MTNPIALAIPFFLLLMAVELLVARLRGRVVYRLQDALADLGCGIGQQISLVFMGAALLAVYAFVYDRLRLVTFAPGSATPWLVAFVGVDFVYYWWHRASHEVNFLWAAHVVHHQSEDYNLAVALRQSIVASVTSVPFNLPLALAGVPPLVLATMQAVSLLYQFWIHTELVGRLGWAERVLNTPSHHRVHHAVNPQYLDKNYAAILMVWDQLFGTFREEREPPVFGTTQPLRSFNPVWAQVQEWFVIAAKARPLPWRQRLRMWFASPAWNPSGSPLPSEDELRARGKFAREIPGALRLYAAVQYLPLVVATFLLLLGQYAAPARDLAAGGVLAGWGLLSLGGLLDGRRWGIPAELARLAAAAALALILLPPAAGIAAAVAAAASAAGLIAASRGLGPAGRAAAAQG